MSFSPAASENYNRAAPMSIPGTAVAGLSLRTVREIDAGGSIAANQSRPRSAGIGFATVFFVAMACYPMGQVLATRSAALLLSLGRVSKTR